LGPQHGLPHNCTHWSVGLGHQLGHNSTLNDDGKDKEKLQLHPLIQVSKTTEVKTAAEKGPRGRHHHTERATAVQDPTSQCCCTRNGHRAACRTPRQKQLSRGAGTTNLPLSTPLSRVRGPPNPPHSSTLQTRLKDCRQSSTKRCPAQAADYHRGSNHLAASPSRKPPPSS
jgi:hypothetical protein